jgi:hypothetical protein
LEFVINKSRYTDVARPLLEAAQCYITLWLDMFPIIWRQLNLRIKLLWNSNTLWFPIQLQNRSYYEIIYVLSNSYEIIHLCTNYYEIIIIIIIKTVIPYSFIHRTEVTEQKIGKRMSHSLLYTFIEHYKAKKEGILSSFDCDCDFNWENWKNPRFQRTTNSGDSRKVREPGQNFGRNFINRIFEYNII